MKVLITNDDGIYAEGLWALYRTFIKNHSVTVVAPDRERSAVSHAITLHEPLRAKRVNPDGGFPGYAVNGTPADCIKLGVLEILGCKPDVVISGINPGANVGVNRQLFRDCRSGKGGLSLRRQRDCRIHPGI